MTKRLFPVDYIEFDVQDYDPSIGYLLGRKSDGRLWRRQVGTTTQAIRYDFLGILGLLLRNIYVLKSGTYIAYLKDNATGNLNYIYRSIDQGASWTQVLLVGSNSTEGHVGKVELLDRCFCEAFVNGQSILLIGEYNINQAVADGRVDGGAKDRVQLWQSIDDGATWFVACNWNANGTNYIRHIHCVKQDPYTKYIYIGIGDTDAQSGLIRWDGVAPWVVDRAPSNYTSTGFLGIGGAQRYRTTDLVFLNDWILNFADASQAAPNEVGIWRFKRDFSNYTRVSNAIASDYPVHAGYWGVSLNGTTAVFITYCDASVLGSNTQFALGLYKTDDQGDTVSHVGRYSILGSPAGSVLPYGFKVILGNIYLNISNPAGKDFDATTVLTEIQETFAFNSPEVVHPVYWVDPVGGTDSTAAKNTPRNAFKTLAYALQSSRVTNGATVMLMPGLHTNSTSFTVAINANARPGSATNTTFIQGYGEGTSFLELDTANTSSQITLDDTSGNITIRDLDVYTKSPTALPLFNTSGYTKTLTYDGTRADYNRWK